MIAVKKPHPTLRSNTVRTVLFFFVSSVFVLLCALAVTRVVMGSGLIRGPYPAPGKSLAWLLGVPETAYNYAMVTEGRVHRSARPDARFLEWMHDTHDIRRVIGLAGADPVHETARKLGMEVTAFTWTPSQLPPQDELDAVVELLAGDESVLVHCASGSDRTGYAVAAYRVERLGWAVDDAVLEMSAHWHNPERYPDLHRALRARFERSAKDRPVPGSARKPVSSDPGLLLAVDWPAGTPTAEFRSTEDE